MADNNSEEAKKKKSKKKGKTLGDPVVQLEQ
jgi:hypothetical protein